MLREVVPKLLVFRLLSEALLFHLIFQFQANCRQLLAILSCPAPRRREVLRNNLNPLLLSGYSFLSKWMGSNFRVIFFHSIYFGTLRMFSTPVPTWLWPDWYMTIQTLLKVGLAPGNRGISTLLINGEATSFAAEVKTKNTPSIRMDVCTVGVKFPQGQGNKRTPSARTDWKHHRQWHRTRYWIAKWSPPHSGRQAK